MKVPSDKVRDAVERWRRHEAEASVSRWRGAPDAPSTCDVASASRQLLSPEIQDALTKSAEHALLSSDEASLLRLHLAQAAEALELCDLRDALASEMRNDTAATSGIRAVSERYVRMAFDARQRADSAARAIVANWPQDPFAPAQENMRTRAEAFLSETDELADEALAWVGRAQPKAGRPRNTEDVVSCVRCESFDGLFSRNGRWRRVAAHLAALGFAEDLARRLHLEPDHPAQVPAVRFALLDPPRNVRMSASDVEFGLLSELAAMNALGRGLAYVLQAPALPASHRRPVLDSTARAIGRLVMSLLAERAFVQRSFPVLEREVDSVARAAATALVLEARVVAATHVFRSRDVATPEARLDLAGELWGRAFRCEPEPAIGGLAFTCADQPSTELRASLGALAAHVALRHRYDADWFRNPRAAEPIRAGASRGGGLSVETWCAELGASSETAVPRLVEMFSG